MAQTIEAHLSTPVCHHQRQKSFLASVYMNINTLSSQYTTSLTEPVFPSQDFFSLSPMTWQHVAITGSRLCLHISAAHESLHPLVHRCFTVSLSPILHDGGVMSNIFAILTQSMADQAGRGAAVGYSAVEIGTMRATLSFS